jgi:zona occludens toxin (predicted ATPase)
MKHFAIIFVLSSSTWALPALSEFKDTPAFGSKRAAPVAAPVPVTAKPVTAKPVAIIAKSAKNNMHFAGNIDLSIPRSPTTVYLQDRLQEQLELMDLQVASTPA